MAVLGPERSSSEERPESRGGRSFSDVIRLAVTISIIAVCVIIIIPLGFIGLVGFTFWEIFKDLRVGGDTSVKKASVKKAPGSTLIALADFFFSPKMVEAVFNQIVADMRDEYFAALSERRRWKARWIRVRYAVKFAQAMGLSKAFWVVRSLAGK